MVSQYILITSFSEKKKNKKTVQDYRFQIRRRYKTYTCLRMWGSIRPA